MTIRNRGKQSCDDKCFASDWQSILTLALDDICYLLSKGYAEPSTIELVGNRYKLNKRQRMALKRVCCSNQAIEKRNNSLIDVDNLKGKIVEIDGFNLLILLESAMSGAFVFKSRDGTYRDISSVHGSYKRVVKTEEAILLIGDVLKSMNVGSVKWYFDRPVSNSGRLKSRIREIAIENKFNWEIDLVFNPDKVLSISNNTIVSSDSWILDNCNSWVNLGAYIIENYLLDCNIIEL